MVRQKAKTKKRVEDKCRTTCLVNRDLPSVSNGVNLESETTVFVRNCNWKDETKTKSEESQWNPRKRLKLAGISLPSQNFIQPDKRNGKAKIYPPGYSSFLRFCHNVPAVLKIGCIKGQVGCIKGQLVASMLQCNSIAIGNSFAGLFIGENDTDGTLLCYHSKYFEKEHTSYQLTEENVWKDQCCTFHSEVPNTVLSALATKFFIVAVNTDVKENGRLYLDVLLNHSHFPESNEKCIRGSRKHVMLVMDYFYKSVLPGHPTIEDFDYTDPKVLYNNLRKHATAQDVHVQHRSLIPKLREYQTQAVQWMLAREKGTGDMESSNPFYVSIRTLDGTELGYNAFNGWFSKSFPTVKNFKGGILADEMGLGKTVEVISCILNNPKVNTKKLVPGIESYRETSDLNEKNAWNAVEMNERFSCLCGPDSEAVRQPPIKCEKCGVWQHPRCLNYETLKPSESYYCSQCWVHPSMGLVPSGATLIVTPFKISYQWVEEFRKHVKVRTLKVFVYRGLAHHKYIPPPELAEYDVVLTTYEVLGKELQYVDIPHNSMHNRRKPQKYFSPTSPLLAIQWWRVCLDEAQMAQHTTTKLAKMALRLNSVIRWCVTGTPIQKSIEDLQGLFLFLGYEPYCFNNWWKEVLYEPYCQKNPQNLFDVLSIIFWRTEKKDVLDQINIPPQHVEIFHLKFSPIEQYFYDEQYKSCSQNFQSVMSNFENFDVELNSLDGNTISKVLNPVKKLRQACCHPEAVKGSMLSLQKISLSMKEVLECQLKKAIAMVEDDNRRLIASLNGLAGISLLEEKYDESINMYKKVLCTAYEHADIIKTDSCQLYHALYNMGHNLCKCTTLNKVCCKKRKLESTNNSSSSSSIEPSKDDLKTHPAITNPLCKKRILEEASKVKEKYLGCTLSAVSNAEDNLNILSIERDSLSKTLGHNEPSDRFATCHSDFPDIWYPSRRSSSTSSSPSASSSTNPTKKPKTWWSRVLNSAQKLDCHVALIEKMKSDLKVALDREKNSVAYRFATVAGLEDMILILLDYFNDCRDKLLNAVLCLPIVPSQFDIDQIRDCHLRPKGPITHKCDLCKTEQMFVKYKQVLYSGERKPIIKRMGSRLVSSKMSGEEDRDKQRLSWCDSEIERILNALLAFAKTNQVNCQIIEKGNLMVKFFSISKKEFKAIRNLLSKKFDHVAAIDELEMARTRFSFGAHLGSNSCWTPPYVIRGTVETIKRNFENDCSLNKASLNSNLRKVYFLQNLCKAENQVSKDGSKILDICPICRQQLEKKWAVLPCGHVLCNDCLHQYVSRFPLKNGQMNMSCPTCREVVYYHDVCFIGEECEVPFLAEYKVLGNLSAKVTAIVKTLLKIQNEDPTAKSLVFSSWMNVLIIIAEALEVNEIPFTILNKKKEFQAEILKFKTDSSINTLLLPAHAGCNGLNILEASNILIVEPLLDLSQEEQAIGRIHRIGQTKNTKIYHYVMSESIETAIHNYQRSQRASSGEKLTLRDMIGLF